MAQLRPTQSTGASEAPEGSQTRPEPRTFAERRLTHRQLQCLYWVFHGKSANDIGGIYGISGRVVEEHLQKACAHFGVKSRHQAAWRAHEMGLFRDIAP